MLSRPLRTKRRRPRFKGRLCVFLFKTACIVVLGACRITLRLAEVDSLKGKRQILKKIIARTQHRFNISIAETAHNDDWQRAEVGFACVGNETPFVNSAVDKTIDYIDSLHLAEIIHTDIEIMHL